MSSSVATVLSLARKKHEFEWFGSSSFRSQRNQRPLKPLSARLLSVGDSEEVTNGGQLATGCPQLQLVSNLERSSRARSIRLRPFAVILAYGVVYWARRLRCHIAPKLITNGRHCGPHRIEFRERIPRLSRVPQICCRGSASNLCSSISYEVAAARHRPCRFEIIMSRILQKKVLKIYSKYSLTKMKMCILLR